MAEYTNLNKIDVQYGLDKIFLDALIDNVAFLKAQVDQLLGETLTNASFENDLDGEGTPDTWALTLYQAGAASLEASKVAHGAKAYKFTRTAGTGNGGGEIESEAFAVISEGTVTIELFYAASAALKSKVEVDFYDAAKAPLSTVSHTIQEKTCYKRFQFDFVTPGGARFYKVRAVGGATDVDVAGSCYFDGIRPTFKFYDYADFMPFTFNETGAISGWRDAGTVSNIYIPADATTFKATIKVTNTGTNLRGRLSIGGTASGTYVEDNTGNGTTGEVSIVLPNEVKGTMATVTVQTYRTQTESAGNVTWTSSFTSGREANLKIEP